METARRPKQQERAQKAKATLPPGASPLPVCHGFKSWLSRRQSTMDGHVGGHFGGTLENAENEKERRKRRRRLGSKREREPFSSNVSLQRECTACKSSARRMIHRHANDALVEKFDSWLVVVWIGD